KGQMRDEGTENISHPIAVSKRLTNPDEIIIALLHDTLEDTDVTYEEIKKEFGIAIADKIQLLTHKKGISYSDYLKLV
ncbi:GTP pyrophosphokinase, partial [Streptococcus gordonii]|nr:GTP pyrophosphokinase [Streptococcus gordonii]